jgi:hypothetical protein
MVAHHRSQSPALRIGPGGDLLIDRTGRRATIHHTDVGDGGPSATVTGHTGGGGQVDLGGWGIAEALRRGATEITAEGVTAGGLVAGPAAWRFGWARADWDELGAAVVAGRILAQADAGTVVEVHPDGAVLVTPATIDGLTSHLLRGVDASELVEPDATVRLYSVRLAPTEGGGVLVHSVRGLPGPSTALVEARDPARWRATATFAVVGIDPEGMATRVWDAAGGAVEVRFTRRERPHPETWADTVSELRVSIDLDDAGAAERALTEAVTAIVEAGLPGVQRLTTRPAEARPVHSRTLRLVPTREVTHTVTVGGETTVIPPAPTQPPPLARRTPDGAAPPPPPVPGRKVAPSVSTHPETIAALRDDLARRRLSAGPADNDSVHWDAQPTRPGALGRLAQACAAPCRRPGDDAVSVALWVSTADAYDWLQWHLNLARFRAMLPAHAVAPVERIELPNLNALVFVIGGPVDMPVALLAEYVRAQAVDLPDELYPSSALRTSAT